MTRAIILALFLASPASAGGLATSPVPPQRPHYAPIMEPEQCPRPVYGRDGRVLYWTGGCVPVDDGSDSDDVQEAVQEPVQPGVVEPPPAVEKPREQDKPDTVDGPCKGVTHRYKPGC